jgi:threonine/homoserine/homoserine lactone efflux protein
MMADGTRMRWFNRGCGGLFALMGALLLLSRRQA